MKAFRLSGILLPAPSMAIAAAWAGGALYYDGPGGWFVALNAAAFVAAFLLLRSWRARFAIFAVWFAAVAGWWLTLRPAHEADWQPDVAQLSWAQIDGDVVILHNVRNCDYRTKDDYTPRWETRTVRLSQLTGADMAVNYWGSPWMAHPIVSFRFADAPPLCFSTETRKKKGQSYSAIGGLYRQFELICIAADERDVLRVRTNFREGEDVYLYHLTISPEQARERFCEYLGTINGLREKPRWYNAITTNCTTSIRQQHAAAQRAPWDWRILVNGKGDELMYERGILASGGTPFPEFKARSHINAAARAGGDAADFSDRIRAGLPGITSTPETVAHPAAGIR
jgi:hypothetical protein